MLPFKTLFFCTGLSCWIGGISYWFLAGVGYMYEPSDSMRTAVSMMFMFIGFLFWLAVAHINLRERNERIAADPHVKTEGQLHDWS